MPISINTAAERNVFSDPPNVINVPANTAILIFTDEEHTYNNANQQIALRLLQNVGANPCFYSENLVDMTNKPPTPVCDGTVNYNGVVAAGQQLDCSGHCQAICVFSVLGTTIATTIRRRIN